MTPLKRIALLLIFTCAGSFTVARAQRPQVSTVNITPDEGRVRVSPQGDVFNLRIEVVDEAGDIIFESAQVSDHQLDWKMRDAHGKSVPPGTYTVTVGYTTQTGKSRKRIEQILVTEEVTSGGGTDKTAAQKGTSSSAPEGPTPLVDGGGVVNRIPKFTDGDTLTSSSMTDIGGRIGIGVSTPAHTLSIGTSPAWTTNNWGGAIAMINGSAIGWNANVAGQRRGIGHTNGGLYFFRTLSNPGTKTSASVYDMVITDAGNVGIGSLTPGSRLDVASANSTAIVGRSTFSSGVGVYGESANFNGVRGVGRNPSHGAVVGVHETGGIAVYGTSGGTGVRGDSTGGAGVYGQTAAGNTTVAGVQGRSTAGGGVGVKGEATTGVYGLSLVNDGAGVAGEANSGKAKGVYGTSTSALGVGVYAANPTGMALNVVGNATQSRDKGGLVKAMLLVNQDGTINRCFNSQRPDGGANSPPTVNTGCGISVNRIASGYYEITFTNFTVSDRFYSVTPKAGFSPAVGSVNVGANWSHSSYSNRIKVNTFLADTDGSDSADVTFMLIVY